MPIIEKKHRLPEEAYWGQKVVSFNACLLPRKKFFVSQDRVAPLIECLATACHEKECVAPVYCFMPDHLHVLILGTLEESRPKEAMDLFKGRTGSWLAEHHPGVRWQKNYYDHVIRGKDDWRSHAAYVMLNPVRAGLVGDPFDYPFTGSIGCNLLDVFWDL